MMQLFPSGVIHKRNLWGSHVMNSFLTSATVLGLGFALSSDLIAQSSNSGSETPLPTIGTSGSFGNVTDLRNDAAYSRLMSGRNPSVIQLSDLLNYGIQAQDGAFGRVSDIVFDRNGNIQYLLGTYQGQTFPLPLVPNALFWSPNTLNYNVPISTLQQLTINPQDLPSLRDQAFLQRMQQVFGSSLGSNFSAYPPGTTVQGRAGSTGNGTTSTAGSSTIGSGSASGANGMVSGSPIGSATSVGARDATGLVSTNNRTWNWPTNPTANLANLVNSSVPTQPGTLNGNVGIGTVNNVGSISRSGATAGTGAITVAPGSAVFGPVGAASGPNSSTGTTSAAGTLGSTVGAASTGTTAGGGAAGARPVGRGIGTTAGAATSGNNAGAVM